jgi:hypothetical protein
MENPEIKRMIELEEKEWFYVDCIQCGKRIKGTTENQTLHNLKRHLETHPITHTGGEDAAEP